MEIKVLGSCCGNSDNLVALVKEVVGEKGLSASVARVTDMMETLSYGVMKTPALVVDGKVVAAGRMPSRDEIAGWLAARKEA